MAVGTLTVVPVRVSRVDRTVAAWAMTAAPLVGVLLAAVGALVLAGALLVGLSPLLAAALAVGALALLTRGLHLDGLADVADGLGGGADSGRALEIMKRSDIGPFGVVTLVFAVLVQVAALAALAERGIAEAALGLAAALLSGRLAITWACTRAVGAARPDGLGAFVARTVPYPAAAAVTCAVLLVGLWDRGWPVAVGAGLVAAGALLLRLRRRLGGMTGDVLGALAETAASVALVVAAAL
ncbi:adenosylcobinamide-GDP ribazoletransferase [Thermobifida halotolerans]|uniref:Adenosylcobinamide-GDP ribazoletransferase n=2 Tax=Thermobifida halotolerans TaxID=483545 RepID=A0AA97M154_9ACTN|nr:adenosylcobinamide-GDP ribazoletransferase [Thermobifida halotolerans]UOE21813.1 adenosylcobinamide-GDP ribazoletransferase [Thermobifida halotolerans]